MIVNQNEYIQSIWKLLFSDFLTHEFHELSGCPDMLHQNVLNYISFDTENVSLQSDMYKTETDVEIMKNDSQYRKSHRFYSESLSFGYGKIKIQLGVKL